METILQDSRMLAYLGDAVWEVTVREKLIRTVKTGSRDANKEALFYVTAAAQAQAAERLLPFLTEEETAVYRRGKNVKVKSFPRNVSPYTYHKATGLEALFGWLYLTGRQERRLELFRTAFPDNC